MPGVFQRDRNYYVGTAMVLVHIVLRFRNIHSHVVYLLKHSYARAFDLLTFRGKDFTDEPFERSLRSAIPPMFALAVTMPPEARRLGVRTEVFDGYRALSVQVNSEVRLFSRNRQGLHFALRIIAKATKHQQLHVNKCWRRWLRAVES